MPSTSFKADFEVEGEVYWLCLLQFGEKIALHEKIDDQSFAWVPARVYNKKYWLSSSISVFSLGTRPQHTCLVTWPVMITQTKSVTTSIQGHPKSRLVEALKGPGRHRSKSVGWTEPVMPGQRPLVLAGKNSIGKPHGPIKRTRIIWHTEREFQGQFQ